MLEPVVTSLLLIAKRMQNVTNGTIRLDPGRLKVNTNPAFLHPDELEAHGLKPGDLAEIRSRHGMIEVVVEADPDLRRGVLGIAHGFGRAPGQILGRLARFERPLAGPGRRHQAFRLERQQADQARRRLRQGQRYAADGRDSGLAHAGRRR